MTAVQKIVIARTRFLSRQLALIRELVEVDEQLAKVTLATFGDPVHAGHFLTQERFGHMMGLSGRPAVIAKTKDGLAAVLDCLEKIDGTEFD
jgi:hypothetical protein